MTEQRKRRSGEKRQGEGRGWKRGPESGAGRGVVSERGQEGERFSERKILPGPAPTSLSRLKEVHFLEKLIPQKSLLQGPHEEERI